ncbi:MAG: hypothetical protein FWG06_00015 [Clostridiales bacterium]|nr:hypothetical protein [Clostridiales bacterium]
MAEKTIVDEKALEVSAKTEEKAVAAEKTLEVSPKVAEKVVAAAKTLEVSPKVAEKAVAAEKTLEVSLKKEDEQATKEATKAVPAGSALGTGDLITAYSGSLGNPIAADSGGFGNVSIGDIINNPGSGTIIGDISPGGDVISDKPIFDKPPVDIGQAEPPPEAGPPAGTQEAADVEDWKNSHTAAREYLQGGYLKMKYAERQFLRAQDFADEQAYHEKKLQDHNRLLHEYGVCMGLLVKKDYAEGLECYVDVGAGYAIDVNGRAILLGDVERVNLGTSQKSGSRYVTNVSLYVRYNEDVADEYKVAEGGFEGYTRLVERPKFGVSPTGGEGGMAEVPEEEWLLLADITRDANTGHILTCNTKPLGRPVAGVKFAAVATGDMADNAVTTAKIRDKSVTAAKIADGAIIADKIANNAVTATKIADHTITTTQLANAAGAQAVATDNIRDSAVTNAKIAAGAVTTAKLASDTSAYAPNAAVGTSNIKDHAVTTAKLAYDTTANSSNAAVATNNIQGKAVTGNKIAAGAVTEDKISSSAVTAAKIGTGAVTNAKIADNAVTTSKIVSLAVSSDKIGGSAVTNAKIADGAVTFSKLKFTKTENVKKELAIDEWYNYDDSEFLDAEAMLLSGWKVLPLEMDVHIDYFYYNPEFLSTPKPTFKYNPAVYVYENIFRTTSTNCRRRICIINKTGKKVNVRILCWRWAKT